MVSMMNLPSSNGSTTWRFVDIQDKIDGTKAIVHNGQEIFTLTSKPMSEWKKWISSKHEAFLYCQGRQLGKVLFPDHLLQKNDIEVTMGDPSSTPAPEFIRVSRVSALSDKHSFSVAWPHQPPTRFTWARASEYGGQKIGRGSLKLLGPNKEELVVFQAMTRGSSAGRFYMSPLIGDELLPLVVLTCAGICAKKARDMMDEESTEGVIEGVAGIFGA